MLALGAWSWRWSRDITRAVSTTIPRMLRMLAGIPRKPTELWLARQMRSWRFCQALALLNEGVPLASGAGLDTRRAIPRAIHFPSQRHSAQMREFYGRVGLAREVRRRRIGADFAPVVVAGWVSAPIVLNDTTCDGSGALQLWNGPQKATAATRCRLAPTETGETHRDRGHTGHETARSEPTLARA